MASTITPTKLTSTLTESISLNGHTYGNTISHTIDTQGEVVQRVMNVGTSETTIFSLSTADGLGAVVGDALAYFRVTNLDDTNSVWINLGIDQSGETDGQVTILLDKKESFILMNNQIAIEADNSGGYALEDIFLIKAKATVAVDIEFLAVTA